MTLMMIMNSNSNASIETQAASSAGKEMQEPTVETSDDTKELKTLSPEKLSEYKSMGLTDEMLRAKGINPLPEVETSFPS